MGNTDEITKWTRSAASEAETSVQLETVLTPFPTRC